MPGATCVSNHHIGGCTETFGAFNDSRLAQLLRDNGIEIELADGVSAYSFLPKMVSYALAGPVARVNH
jgi:hypothetical protein